jgi:hypothetical protein
MAKEIASRRFKSLAMTFGLYNDAPQPAAPSFIKLANLEYYYMA